MMDTEVIDEIVNFHQAETVLSTNWPHFLNPARRLNLSNWQTIDLIRYPNKLLPIPILQSPSMLEPFWTISPSIDWDRNLLSPWMPSLPILLRWMLFQDLLSTSLPLSTKRFWPPTIQSWNWSLLQIYLRYCSLRINQKTTLRDKPLKPVLILGGTSHNWIGRIWYLSRFKVSRW